MFHRLQQSQHLLSSLLELDGLAPKFVSFPAPCGNEPPQPVRAWGRRARAHLGKVMGTAHVFSAVTFTVFPGGHLSPLFSGLLVKDAPFPASKSGLRKQSAKVAPTEGHMGSVSLPELRLCAWVPSTPRGMGSLWAPPCRGLPLRSRLGRRAWAVHQPRCGRAAGPEGAVWLDLPQHGTARRIISFKRHRLTARTYCTAQGTIFNIS